MKKFIKSFYHSFNGIEEAFKQRNIKVQSFAALLIILSSIYFEISTTEWLFVISAIFFVIVIVSS